jgi:hypothetical protein
MLPACHTCYLPAQVRQQSVLGLIEDLGDWLVNNLPNPVIGWLNTALTNQLHRVVEG